MELFQIASAVINEGYEVSQKEAVFLYKNYSAKSLAKAADKIRNARAGNAAFVCSIINAKSGGCGEDCKYCAQSAHWKTACKKTPFVSKKAALDFCKAALENNVFRVALVASGKSVCGEDFEKALEIFSSIKNAFGKKISLCASFGLLSQEKLFALKAAGVSRFHHNLETSENFFPKICTTHTYADRVKTIEAARLAGLEICSGGIIGMGESVEDRIELALAARALGAASVPINILTAIKGTPLQNVSPLQNEEILKTISIFRILLPNAQIRCAAGRRTLGKNGRRAFNAGANAMISGDFLTTAGSKNSEDVAMLLEMGFEIKP